LKLKCDDLLLNFGFKFNLRHYTMERNFRPAEAAARAVLATGAGLRLPQWLTARFTAGRGAAGSHGRGIPSSTFQLNLSRF
jgi:hypothetical protein